MAYKCDECTLCCKVMGIDELQKPQGIVCEHVCEKGCAIYPSRPPSCRAFNCLWLQSGDWPNPMRPEFRPDRSGVVLTTDMEGKVLVVWADPDRPLSWAYGPMDEYLRSMASTIPMIIMGEEEILREPSGEAFRSSRVALSPPDVQGLRRKIG